VSVEHCHTASRPVEDNLVVQLVVGSQDYFEGDSRDCFEGDNRDCFEGDIHLAHLGEDSRPTMMSGQPMDTTRGK
jgi:hypothetical protein